VLIVTVLIYSRFQGDRIEQNMEIQPLFKATKNAFTSLLMPVVILGGIYGGVFTPTEAASAAVAYALIVGVVVHRELPVSEIVPIATRSLMSTANILLIIAAAGVFSYLISRAGVPASIGRWITANFDSSIAFLLMVNLVLLLLGMFLETSASIIILTPILAPVAMAFGINPLHFGLIMIVNLALGMITPPFAVNLFAACQVAKIGIEEAMRPLLMFVCVMFLCLMLITFIPAISLTLVP
jgi:tripartite ATP-independent transporter DctM subunit